jgi:hypothetical protein
MPPEATPSQTEAAQFPATLMLDSSNDWTLVILACFCSDFLFLRSAETFAQKIPKITKVRIQKIDFQLLLAKEGAAVPLNHVPI